MRDSEILKKIDGCFVGLKTKKFAIILIFLLILGGLIIYKNYQQKKSLDRKEIANAIQKIESEEGPRISKDPTEEEVYSNEYVKHIRNGLNGYLDGTNTGVEEFAIEKSNIGDSEICGLDNFDKSYYKSKFIVIAASDADYGGLQASVFFIDKPDTLFWVWVYKLGGGDYVLRGFCKKEIPEDMKSDFPSFIEAMIKGSKYSL